MAGAFSQSAIAQDEDLDVFYREYRNVVIRAAQTGTKSVTIRLHTHFSESFRGDKVKLKITFLNDSVFQRKYRRRKATYIIRGDELYPYDRDTTLYTDITAFSSVDSAGYMVNWGKAYDGMKDSSALTYSRLKFDTLGRLVDYYYTFDSTCTHLVSQYFGDTVSIIHSWSSVGDSMVLKYSQYRLLSYNDDSTFYINILKYTHQNDGHYRRWDTSTERAYITYDEKRRIVEMKIEELSESLDGDDWPFSHTMEVRYK